VTVDGTLLSIDRVGRAAGRDRPYYSGKHKRYGVNVQVTADPAGRLVWASPAMSGRPIGRGRSMAGTVVFRGVPNQPESASRSASAAGPRPDRDLGVQLIAGRWADVLNQTRHRFV
jgi:hypothetical protein